MDEVDSWAALDEVRKFVAFAVERLAGDLGEEHPQVVAGRRALVALETISRDTVLVTEETLAAAMHRAYPSRRVSSEVVRLSAATVIAALRSADGSRAR